MELTENEKVEIEKINNMCHEEMCKLWKYAPTGHIYFDSTKPYVKIFEDRLFNHFGGFTPELSKRIN